MNLYYINIVKFDNTLIYKFEVSHLVNLKLLIPFEIVKPPYLDLIKIELVDLKHEVLSAIYIEIEKLFIAIESIKSFYHTDEDMSINKSLITLVNNKIEDSKIEKTKAELLNQKNEQALTFYFKSKWRKMVFFTITFIMAFSLCFKINDSFVDHTLIGHFNSIGLIFLLTFIILVVFFIVKKIANNNISN